MENLLANTITKNFFNIGKNVIYIILSYTSDYKKVDFEELPNDWKFITVFANRNFYKLILYEEKLELYFSCNKNLEVLPNNIAFDFAIQYSIFRYSKYYKQMILNGYSVDADGFQEYFNEELDFFINHFYIRTFFHFLTNNLSKFNTIINKYSYLRQNKYFCKNCHELYESHSRNTCECQDIVEDSSSEDEDISNWDMETGVIIIQNDRDDISSELSNEDSSEQDSSEQDSSDENSSEQDSSYENSSYENSYIEEVN